LSLLHLHVHELLHLHETSVAGSRLLLLLVLPLVLHLLMLHRRQHSALTDSSFQEHALSTLLLQHIHLTLEHLQRVVSVRGKGLDMGIG
jgi:hypothetical protein